MADNTTLPGTGDVISADDIAGVKVQRVKVQYGPDGTATDVDTATGMPTTAGYLEVSGSASANNTNLITADVAAYRYASVQIIGTWSGTVSWQQSNDNTNWISVMLGRTDGNGDPNTGTTNNNINSGTLSARYFRVRFTAYSSGTATAIVGFSALPGWQNAAQMKVTSGATFPVSGSVTPTPGTTGGWSVSSQTALSNTKTQIKSSAGTFGGYMIYNPTVAVAYVQVWDVANASITVGTTAPTYVLSIPAGSAANLELTCGVNHATAINVAATTTPTGSTAPASALTCALFYK